MNVFASGKCVIHGVRDDHLSPLVLRIIDDAEKLINASCSSYAAATATNNAQL